MMKNEDESCRDELLSVLKELADKFYNQYENIHEEIFDGSIESVQREIVKHLYYQAEIMGDLISLVEEMKKERKSNG